MFGRRDQGRSFSRRSVHGGVAHEIGRRIADGTFPEGEVLPVEARLCEEWGVSRTVLREAIKVLTAKGLVEPKPKIGTRVRPRDEWNLLDPDVLAWVLGAGDVVEHALNLTEMRRILEPAAAALAARRAGPEDVARIELALADMAAAGDDVERVIAPDLRFHQAILKATGNEFMTPIGFAIESAFAASFKLSSSYPGSQRNSLPLHRAVFERIRDHDPAGAEAAMLGLLDATLEDIRWVAVRQREAGPRPDPAPAG